MHKTVSTPLGDIHVYSFELIDSRMYMLRRGDELLIIDPCIDEQLFADGRGVSRVTVFLTHEHFDHISGVNWLREQYPCRVYASETCAEYIQSEEKNACRRFPLLFVCDKEKYHYAREHFGSSYTCRADESFREETSFDWQGLSVTMIPAPGHSPAGGMLLLENQLLFAGDSLLGNGQELKSIGASREDYNTFVLERVERLPEEVLVFPGHGEADALPAFVRRIRQYI